MIGSIGINLGALRIGAGVIGAALLAFALPATNGAGPFGSVAPKQAAAAAPSCNATKSITKGSGNLARSTSIPVYKGSTDCVLGKNNAGPAVRTLQTALNRCYQSRLKVDGIYGPYTRAAVLDAQRRSGTRADGVYGLQTYRHISWPFVNEYGRQSCEQSAGAH